MKMKKILAFVLSLTMTAVMGTTAFAAQGDANVGTGSTSIDVKAKYAGETTAPTVYNVDMSWGAMEFTYAVGGTRDWNPETHEYKDNTTAKWVENGNTVTVTNHSNASVETSFAFDAMDTYDTVTGKFDNAKMTLPSAEGKAVDAAELTGTTKLTLSGTLESNVTALTKIGTITVTIK